MLRQNVHSQSPLRILEHSSQGGLGQGKLGVIMARAGVGKTAFLIQVGLDNLLREKDVLHIALGQSLEHVQSWYDGLFDDLARATELKNREQLRRDIARKRFIYAQPGQALRPEQLDAKILLATEHLGLKPSSILIDGIQWEDESGTIAADLAAFKNSAERLGAELWLSAQTHRDETGGHPTRIPEPCSPCSDIIDMALFLEPQGHMVSVRIIKDHDNDNTDDTRLELEPGTLQIASDDGADDAVVLPAEAYTLLSGGAKGAEAEFGACAQEWSCMERNYSFAGREVQRDRGLVLLTEAELKQGEVSRAYIESKLNRTFPKTEMFSKMLHSIWHQVATSKQVFAVGQILDDKTVKGGTGWATELAKHFNKPLHVYDQEKLAWFMWRDGEWVKEEQPKIRHNRFTGTGTRFLNDKGKAAIRALFQASFGPLKTES